MASKERRTALGSVLFGWIALACAGCGGAPPRDPDGVGMTNGPAPIASDTSSGVSLPDAAPPSALPSASSPLPSAPPSVAPSAAASEAPPAAEAGKPAKVTVGDPKFEGGDVPKAKAALDKLGKAITKCVNDHGGLTGSKGSIDVVFLVRAEGIAEGVDVQGAKGIGVDAKKCVRDAFKKKRMGPPSSDPVGVTLKIDLDPASGGT